MNKLDSLIVLIGVGLAGCGDRADGPREIEVADTGEIANEIEGEVDGEADGEGDAHAGDAADAADGCGARCVRGRIVRDHRQVDAARTRLLAPEIVPVPDFAVNVREGAREVARGRTDADGRFALPLERAPVEPLELVFVAVVGGGAGEGGGAGAGEGAGVPAIAVFDSVNVAVPSHAGVAVTAERLWAWVAAPLPGGSSAAGVDFGEVHVSEAGGAGAIAVLEVLTRLRARAAAVFGAAPAELPTLAVLWSPTHTPSCLSCYLPTGWGPITWRASSPSAPAVVFDRALFLSGADAAPHHFTPSLPAHELGHWVMDSFSRFPDAGGAHGWDQLLAPPLAWSEGFATFFGQWALSADGALEPRFFGKQAHTEYWIDLEAIGSDPSSDDTSLSLVFQRPDAASDSSQDLNEAIVAAILWDLWDVPAPSGGAPEPETVALGDAALRAIATARMLALDRGASGPDLVDYLDALACPEAAPIDWTAALIGFPWDGRPLCP